MYRTTNRPYIDTQKPPYAPRHRNVLLHPQLLA